MAETRAEYERVAEAHAQSQADKQRVLARTGARQSLTRSTGRRLRRRSRPSSARASSRATMSRSSFPISTGRLSSRHGSSRAAIRRCSTIPSAARRRASLFDDAQAMLKRIVEERWFKPKAVIGFWPANSRRRRHRALHGRVAQRNARRPSSRCASSSRRRDGKPNIALADFVAPKESGKADYVGAFVVTAGAEEEKISARFARANDDYGVDHGEGAGRPHRGSFRRAHA